MNLTQVQIVEQLQESIDNMADLLNDESFMDPDFETICELIEQFQQELEFLRSE